MNLRDYLLIKNSRKGTKNILKRIVSQGKNYYFSKNGIRYAEKMNENPVGRTKIPEGSLRRLPSDVSVSFWCYEYI